MAGRNRLTDLLDDEVRGGQAGQGGDAGMARLTVWRKEVNVEHTAISEQIAHVQRGKARCHPDRCRNG